MFRFVDTSIKNEYISLQSMFPSKKKKKKKKSDNN